jgi:hypothetical protein
MGLGGPGGRADAGWVGPTGSAQSGRVGFVFFFEFIFNAKTIPEKPRNCLKARKNTPKITKIPGKFLEID